VPRKAAGGVTINSMAHELEDMISAVATNLAEKVFRADMRLEVLTPAERTVFLLYCLDAGVCNGGFVSFISNPFGHWCVQALEALCDIGADWIANPFAEVVRIFPRGKPPLDINARNEALEELPERADLLLKEADEAFFANRDVFLALLSDYVKRHTAET